IAVVTSVDPDHLDIYGDDKHLKAGFIEFIQLIDKKGWLFAQKNALEKLAYEPTIKTIPYGIQTGVIHAANVKPGIASFEFDYRSPSHHIEGVVINMPGFHNVENALAAIGVALQLGVAESEIRAGLKSFKGVKRRFEILHQEEGKVYIDDYAHH